MPSRIAPRTLNLPTSIPKPTLHRPPTRASSSYTHLSLAGHHALITGGSRGIGKAIAARLSSLSAHTTIIGRNAPTLRSALHEIAAASPASPSTPLQPAHGYVVGDISTKGFWEMLSRSLILRHTLPASKPSTSQRSGAGAEQEEEQAAQPHTFNPAPLTLLINAAGVTHNALLVRQSPSAAEDVVQTNLMGTVWGCKVLGKALIGNAKQWRKQPSEGERELLKGGLSIVNVSSLLAVQGGVGSAAYAASKAGVLGLTRALAGEMGSLGVRVNAIVPGYVETDMTAAMQTSAREKALERIPLKRFGTVEEIADAAVFLATNQYANNCVINLDGGMSAVSNQSCPA